MYLLVRVSFILRSIIQTRSGEHLTHLVFFLGAESTDVGFVVYPLSAINTTLYGALKFDMIERNVGNGYNSSTGKFYAPMGGLYHFYFSLMGDQSGYVVIGLLKNYAYETRAAISKNGTTSCSIYMRMQYGDNVYLEADRSGGKIHEGRYSTFGGELIRY